LEVFGALCERVHLLLKATHHTLVTLASSGGVSTIVNAFRFGLGLILRHVWVQSLLSFHCGQTILTIPKVTRHSGRRLVAGGGRLALLLIFILGGLVPDGGRFLLRGRQQLPFILRRARVVRRFIATAISALILRGLFGRIRQ
jgi:hypothetical protein